MKVDNKTVPSDLRVTYRTIEFADKAIDKLKIISTKKNIDVRFKSLPSYLRGLHLKYSPITQLKKFYLRYKYKGKAIPLVLGEFISGHYEVIQVSKEVLSLHEKYYVNGKWKHNPKEQLITQRELELSQELSVRETIQRIVQVPNVEPLGKTLVRTTPSLNLGLKPKDETKEPRGFISKKEYENHLINSPTKQDHERAFNMGNKILKVSEATKNKMADEYMRGGGRDPNGRSLDQEIKISKDIWLQNQKMAEQLRAFKEYHQPTPVGLGDKYKSDIRLPVEHKRAEFKAKVEAKKAKAEASKNTRLTPVVVCKMNTRDPLVILDLDHFMSLIR